MAGFEEYYNIREFPKAFLKDLDEMNKKFKKKHPDWPGIDVLNNEWPEGNAVRLNYGDMTLNDLSEIDVALQALFQKYDVRYEVYSGGFTATDED